MHTQQLPIVALVIAIAALLASLWAGYTLWKIERLRKNFYAGDEVVNLEQILSSLATQAKNLRAEHEAVAKELERLAHNTKASVQKTGMVRFNSFGDSGGNLSFVVALLDAHDTGIVITSMFGREQNRVYTKPIQNAKSELNLTEEEEQAIKQAMANWQTKIIPQQK